MTCRSCGAEIADKAIVCYRCGTPTAEPPARSVPRKDRPGWAALLVLLVVFVLGAWLIPKTAPGSPARIAAWVVTWIVLLAAAAWARRRGRS
jgi:hypothetical protein